MSKSATKNCRKTAEQIVFLRLVEVNNSFHEFMSTLSFVVGFCNYPLGQKLYLQTVMCKKYGRTFSES